MLCFQPVTRDPSNVLPRKAQASGKQALASSAPRLQTLNPSPTPARLQGHDTRMSGHFVYSSSPDFTTAPPLRCTNRTEVTRWLEGFGVRDFLGEGVCGQLPELSAADKKRLLTGEPVWAKPQMDMSSWTAVRWAARRGLG